MSRAADDVGDTRRTGDDENSGVLKRRSKSEIKGQIQDEVIDRLEETELEGFEEDMETPTSERGG